MSTYVLMRILESAPRRYDLGIRLLTLGRLEKAYDRLAGRVVRGQRVLDLGCGTGALTLRAARRGASVKGIDPDAGMLEVARLRVREAGLTGTIDLAEMGAAELDGEEAESYDAVMSGLCLSELSEDELTYTLDQVKRILRPGGLLIIADEIRPGSAVKRLTRSLIRIPLAFLTYVITQQRTHPLANLGEKLVERGFLLVSVRLSPLESFGEYVARTPEGQAS
jgi:ubiquinone/menaquinone biosynthesis C-methylase UbiE